MFVITALNGWFHAVARFHLNHTWILWTLLAINVACLVILSADRWTDNSAAIRRGKVSALTAIAFLVAGYSFGEHGLVVAYWINFTYGAIRIALMLALWASNYRYSYLRRPLRRA